jgi:hypothetical protein
MFKRREGLKHLNFENSNLFSDFDFAIPKSPLLWLDQAGNGNGRKDPRDLR